MEPRSINVHAIRRFDHDAAINGIEMGNRVLWIQAGDLKVLVNNRFLPTVAAVEKIFITGIRVSDALGWPRQVGPLWCSRTFVYLSCAKLQSRPVEHGKYCRAFPEERHVFPCRE